MSASAYSGSESCGNCHPVKLETWSVTGHHSSLIDVDGAPPDYPFNFYGDSVNVPQPPVIGDQLLSWDDIDYVIGGFSRSAVFIDYDGQIIAGGDGDSTFWNVREREWQSYHESNFAQDDCYQCHVTGYQSEPDISWAEDGVGCEACHGPDS